MKIFNHKYKRDLRRKMRNNATQAEIFLWNRIRNKQLGPRFRRQVGIDEYIVDFYCYKAKLVIEIDGDTHYGTQAIENDQKRDQNLNSIGLSVLRFTNLDVLSNIDEVVRTIMTRIEPDPPPSPP